MLASVAINGLPVILGAIKGLLARRVNVDELLALAIIACLLNGELLTAAEITFSRDGGTVIADCLPTVLCRELDRICDALLNHPA